MHWEVSGFLHASRWKRRGCKKNAGMAASHCWGPGAEICLTLAILHVSVCESAAVAAKHSPVDELKPYPTIENVCGCLGYHRTGCWQSPTVMETVLGGAISLSLLMRRCQTTCGTPSSGNGGQQGRRRRQVERPGAWSIAPKRRSSRLDGKPATNYNENAWDLADRPEREIIALIAARSAQ